jgi:type I restriction enzyme S subunit
MMAVYDVRSVWWMLRSKFFRELLLEYVPGGIKTELKSKRLLPIPVPLPPVREQRRIVSRIEELSAKVEDERLLRQEILSHEVPSLLYQIFLYAFRLYCSIEVRVALPLVRLYDICSLITDGTHQTPRYVEEEMPFLSAQNVKPYRFMPEVHRKVSLDDYAGYTRYTKPEKGDVLMTRVGAMIGEAAMIDRDLDFAFYVSLCLIKPRLDRVHTPYLVHWLNSPFGVAAAKEKTLGQGHSQGNLNLKLIREFTLPLPPIDEQMRLTGRLDEVQARIDEVNAIQLQTARELDSLMPSILDKAFRGAL